MDNHTEPANSLTQTDHHWLAKKLCELCIGMNHLADTAKKPDAQAKAAYNHAIHQVKALRAGLHHHCLTNGWDSDYYDHLETDGPRLVLEYHPADEHTARLVPVAQAVYQIIATTPPCSCVLATAERLLNAMHVVRQLIEQGRFA